MDKLLDMICTELDKITEIGITSTNLDRISKLMDIKDKIMDYEYKHTKTKTMMPKEDGWEEEEEPTIKDMYLEAKKAYRHNPTNECKRKLLNKLEDYMDNFAEEMQEMLKDAECQDERTTIQRYINRIREFK